MKLPLRGGWLSLSPNLSFPSFMLGLTVRGRVCLNWGFVLMNGMGQLMVVKVDQHHYYYHDCPPTSCTASYRGRLRLKSSTWMCSPVPSYYYCWCDQRTDWCCKEWFLLNLLFYDKNLKNKFALALSNSPREVVAMNIGLCNMGDRVQQDHWFFFRPCPIPVLKESCHGQLSFYICERADFSEFRDITSI